MKLRAWDWFWSATSTSISMMSQEAQALTNPGPLKAVIKPETEMGTNPSSLVVRNVIHSIVKRLPP